MHWCSITFSPSVRVELLFFIFKVSFEFTKHHLIKNPLCHTVWTKMLSSIQCCVPLGSVLFRIWEACHLSAPGCPLTVKSVRWARVLLWTTRDVAPGWHWFNHWFSLGMNGNPVLETHQNLSSFNCISWEGDSAFGHMVLMKGGPCLQRGLCAAGVLTGLPLWLWDFSSKFFQCLVMELEQSRVFLPLQTICLFMVLFNLSRFPPLVGETARADWKGPEN